MKRTTISINIIGKVPPPIGGVTIHTLRLYRWLKQDKSLSIKFSSLNKNDIEDTDVRYIGNYFAWITKKLVFGFKEDIVHYQGANYFGLILLYLIKLVHPNFKLVLSVHGEGYVQRLEKRRYLSKIIYFILNRLDLIITSGEHLKEQLLSINIKSKIEVIDPFLMPLEDDKKVYPEYLSDIINTEKFIISANAFNIDKIDNDSDLYGLHILSNIAKRLNNDKIDFKMIIMVANKNDTEYLDKLFLDVKNVFIVSDVSVNGWQVLADSDLMIRPTSTDGDALSIKEALSFGVDVIASDVTPRDKNVTLFHYSDIDELYTKVLDKIENKNSNNLTKGCIENSINHFIKNYRKLVEND